MLRTVVGQDEHVLRLPSLCIQGRLLWDVYVRRCESLTSQPNWRHVCRMLQQVWICLEEYYGGSKGYDVSPFKFIPLDTHPLPPFTTTDAPFHLAALPSPLPSPCPNAIDPMM